MHMFPMVLSHDFSCCRDRVMTLDTKSTVWNFESWGRPYRLASPLLDCSSPETTPIQIQCHLTFSAVLMRSGDVYAWRGYMECTDIYDAAIAGLDMDESTRAIVPDGGTIIPCHTWEIKMDPSKLPIPLDLPDLPMTGLPEEERRKEIKFIKIAAVRYGLVGLTNKGHVCLLKVDLDELLTGSSIWHYVSESAQMIWYLLLNRSTQLPNFSEVGKVKKHPAFHATKGSGGKERPPQAESSDTMLITHVSSIALTNSQCRV